MTLDPFHEWLEIPSGTLQPNFYQILGIPPGESNLQSIESAAKRRHVLVESKRGSGQDETVETILSLIDDAASTLLVPEFKSSYDSQFGFKPKTEDRFAAIDPYHEWLDLPSGTTQPNFYQILGLSPGENNLKRIESAGTKRIALVETNRGKGHDDEVDKILSLIDDATSTLLVAEFKLSYDAQLGFKAKPKWQSKLRSFVIRSVLLSLICVLAWGTFPYWRNQIPSLLSLKDTVASIWTEKKTEDHALSSSFHETSDEFVQRGQMPDLVTAEKIEQVSPQEIAKSEPVKDLGMPIADQSPALSATNDKNSTAQKTSINVIPVSPPKQTAMIKSSTSLSQNSSFKGRIAKGNVALASRGATIGGFYKGEGVALDGKKGDNADSDKAKLHAPVVLTLSESYQLSCIRVLLIPLQMPRQEYPGMKKGASYYRYSLEVSVDGKNFETIADRTRGEHRGWQNIEFPSRPVKAIRIVGTFDYPAQTGIRIAEIEAYSNKP